jgi:hypothetical protein
VRAQLLQCLAEPVFTLQSLSNRTSHTSTQDDPANTTESGNSGNSGTSAGSTVELHAEVLVESNPAAALDTLITRLSLEPGIGSVSWRSEDPDICGDDDRDDSRDGARAGFSDPDTTPTSGPDITAHPPCRP